VVELVEACTAKQLRKLIIDMSLWDLVKAKICIQTEAKKCINHWKKEGNELVFTNGCFDILHYGHLRYLAEARDLGTKLIVGVNSDASVKRLKGSERPIHNQETRCLQLAALSFVDLVIVFEEDTPQQLIELLTPDFLVKGGDYTIELIVGADWVIAHGGEVRTLPYHAGFSTSKILEKIRGL
jgi:D-glycero-beta-D-manno-heptose 1-phosphate adenylyltransferase